MTTPPWWLQETKRLIQMNFRDFDADLDPDTYLALAQQYHAQVVLFNVGGLVANYPTTVTGHFVNPFVKGDLVAVVVKRAHQTGLRVIGRFDFSKVHQSIAADHPDWLYRNVKGEAVNYNGFVHTCPNSEYQQQVVFDILREALQRYELDGVFFNMPGYQTYDYSGVYHGICQCAACRTRFRQAAGMDLPLVEDRGDALFRAYSDFKRVTSAELFERFGSFVHAQRPGVALATYAESGVDIVVSESNSDPERPLPESMYSASEQVKHIVDAYNDKVSCNLAMHFAGIGYRHVGVSPQLTELRLAQDIIHGGWAGFVVIGQLDQQADRRCLPQVRELFTWHAAHHQLLGRTRSRAQILCVKPSQSELHASAAEYHGLFRLLSEASLPFDTIGDYRLGAANGVWALGEYQAVILPDVRVLSDVACAALDEYVNQGGALLVTGQPAGWRSPTELRSACGLQSLGLGSPLAVHPDGRGRYVRIRSEDHSVFHPSACADMDLVYLTGEFAEYAIPDGATGHLRYVTGSLFGPPEKCAVAPDTTLPALFTRRFGAGRTAFFPFRVGEHYMLRSHAGHAELLTGVLEGALGFERQVRLEPALSLLELSHRQIVDGKGEWLGLVNHSGANETELLTCFPLHHIIVHLRPLRPVAVVRLLRAGREIEFSIDAQEWLTCCLPVIGRFEILALDYRR